MKQTSLLVLIPAALAISACGTTKNDRIASGAAIGAGTGAVVGAVVAGQPWAGAAVGAAVGGVAGGTIGAVTSPKDINLGRPAWK